MAVHYIKNVIRELRWIKIVKPYPFDTRYPGHVVDQAGKGLFAINVQTIARQVLCDDVEFLYAFGGQ